MRSASRSMGARDTCAWRISATMRASTLASPSVVARYRKLPVVFSVPPATVSPGFFSTGMGSPVSIDSFTKLDPSTISPSTGSFSPGRTTMKSPRRTCAIGNLVLGAVASHSGSRRLQTDQLTQSPGGLALGSRFQRPARDHEGDNQHRGFKIHVPVDSTGVEESRARWSQPPNTETPRRCPAPPERSYRPSRAARP